jgi:hypothetical protein
VRLCLGRFFRELSQSWTTFHSDAAWIIRANQTSESETLVSDGRPATKFGPEDGIGMETSERSAHPPNQRHRTDA